MEKLATEFTLKDLITTCQMTTSTINTIHLLTDEREKFVVAVSWNKSDDMYFKMFKQQNKFEVEAFSSFISEYKNDWHEKIALWLEHPRTPLKLRS